MLVRTMNAVGGVFDPRPGLHRFPYLFSFVSQEMNLLGQHNIIIYQRMRGILSKKKSSLCVVQYVPILQLCNPAECISCAETLSTSLDCRFFKIFRIRIFVQNITYIFVVGIKGDIATHVQHNIYIIYICICMHRVV